MTLTVALCETTPDIHLYAVDGANTQPEPILTLAKIKIKIKIGSDCSSHRQRLPYNVLRLRKLNHNLRRNGPPNSMICYRLRSPRPLPVLVFICAAPDSVRQQPLQQLLAKPRPVLLLIYGVQVVAWRTPPPSIACPAPASLAVDIRCVASCCCLRR